MDFIQEDKYIGKQVIIDSDRLIFNGREDQIFSAKKFLSFKTDGEVHFNSRKDVFINGPRIFIGPVENNQDVNIPAVRSRELKLILSDLIGALELFFQIQYPLTSGLMGPNPGVTSPLAQPLLTQLKKIKTRLDDIDSKKVFIR
jgi:hypothetical protein